MKISEVKLRKDGLEITWEKYEMKKGLSFRVEHKDKRSAPVQEDLIKCFSWLKPHALTLAGYTNKDINDIEINAVKIGSEGGYILKGHVNTIGDLYMKIETPEAGNGEYDHIKDLESIVKGLFSEVKDYMETDKMMSVESYVKKHNAHKEDFDVKAFENMPKEEKLEVYIALIEKAGGIVMMREDIEIETKNTKKTPIEDKIIEIKTEIVEKDEINLPENQIDIDDFTMIPIKIEKNN